MPERAGRGVRVVRAQRRGRRERVRDIPLVIAAGGALGAVARYGLSVALPRGPGSFPWSTFLTNVLGCLLIGALMVVLTEVAGRPHRLVRPFVGVGVLGGFTTFSTYAVDTLRMVDAGAPATAFAYLLGTLLGALLAVEAGMVMTRALTRAHRQRGI
ncbi:fluoride efflux transporter CrcB [Georgenia sp. SYP-B2076]|uniref:fluoride efflux transporter CrcB n=1 Tax=Georgenia sp. SYP-B2076 TaxID=2495881 RepID=UPI000F8D3C2C|nr:fluoride efflux transporter CrcB [Georgenia sp. SYP-B2076]